ncbi:hypothetical protein PFLUV_G00010990 [Perca fluviatilis]|uniref:Myb/SANT-like DNA-binding domain-containing protein n=1 Tax=Perca fluviatilis TaxID=8168 RepID=A0A6A5FRV6_PERFL|nr:hypothetical protein PFLUV_G00010990 [Perca fluviatilis]
MESYDDAQKDNQEALLGPWTLVKEIGLEGKLTGQQAAKKWENLKQKYKELRTTRTGSGTDRGEVTAATWQFYEDMHEVLGARPSVDPPVLVASCSVDVDPAAILMEPSSPASSSSSSSSAVSRSPLPSPSPAKKRKRNAILDFLTEEFNREQWRHEESEAENKANTRQLLSLLERIVEKL